MDIQEKKDKREDANERSGGPEGHHLVGGRGWERVMGEAKMFASCRVRRG